MRARDNPFAVDRVLAVRYRLPAGSWEELLARLAARGHRGAIVGPEGSGKTTLLEDLASRLGPRGFSTHLLRARPGVPFAAPPRPGPADLLLVDGADALPRTAWLALRLSARRAGGLVVTTHRPGLLPTLHQCATSPELLAGIVRDLLGEEDPAVTERFDQLFHRHGGNLRDALRELYDHWAAR